MTYKHLIIKYISFKARCNKFLHLLSIALYLFLTHPCPNPKKDPTENSCYSLSCPYESFQTLKALSNISASKDWSKIKVYSDLCVQTARKAMAHLVHTFKTELKTLTKAGKYLQRLFYVCRFL